MPRGGYTAVPREDEGEEDALRLHARARARAVGRKANRLCHILAWFGAAALVLFYSRLAEVIETRDGRVRWALVWAAVACVCFNTAAVLYLSVWLAAVRGRVIHDYYAYAPVTISAVTASGASSYALFVAGFWPVYRWATPVMFVVLYFAFFFAVSLLPNRGPCRSPPEDEPGEEDARRLHED